MIEAGSYVSTGVQIQQALARLDEAARAVADGGDVQPPREDGIAQALVAMLAARMAVRASLEAMRGSHEMLAALIDFGGYGVSAKEQD
jgi:hypothetical protein